MKKCTNCDCNNANDSKFCKKCGNSIDIYDKDYTEINSMTIDDSYLSDITQGLEFLQTKFGFLIISKGIYYIQFQNNMLDNLRMEVVSDYFLEEIKPKCSRLRELGFKRAPKGNFYKLISIKEDLVQCCINEIREVFTDVFEEDIDGYTIESDLPLSKEVNQNPTISNHDFKLNYKAIVAIIIVLFIIYKLNNSNEEPQNEHQQYIESQFNSWNGSHKKLTEFIKNDMNDPDSYEHVKTQYWDMDTYIVVATTFRGKNAFGGKVINTVKAKVDLSGNIISIIDTY